MSEGYPAFSDPSGNAGPDLPTSSVSSDSSVSPRRTRHRAAVAPSTAAHHEDETEFVPGRFVRQRRRQTPSASRSPIHRVLCLTVIAVALLHLIALVLLWPHGTAPVAPGANTASQGLTYSTAEVSRLTTKSCPGTTDTRLPDGTVPTVTSCAYADVALADGADAGRTITVSVPVTVVRSGLSAGDDVELEHYPAVAGAPSTYAYSDFSRRFPLTLLAVVFAVLVIVVARLRGLMALVGLGLAFATIGLFVLPALHRGENAAAVSAVGAGAIMIVILYATHGFSTKTTTALLGTLAGIWTTAALASWVTAAAHLNGLASEENDTLSRLTTGGSLSGFVLAGIVLAGLGVLNDVTITQASAVWELRRHAPHLGVAGLFTSGMRIGRDHLASTIYTIAFAYAGVALPIMLLVSIYGTPIQEVLNSGQIAEEIARTLAASIGLVLAIPLTTIIAAGLATRSHPGNDPETAHEAHGHLQHVH